MTQPSPFTLHVPDEVLDDLRARLARTRWPEPLPYPGWTSGVDLAYLRELVGYWATSFDWRAQERRLNSFPQFTADVEGLTVHFLHQRGRGPRPFPLVLTHGWPSSFVELLKLVPLLADPAAHGGDARDGFDVVVPSLPGFAFSGRPARPGVCTARAIATLWARLRKTRSPDRSSGRIRCTTSCAGPRCRAADTSRPPRSRSYSRSSSASSSARSGRPDALASPVNV